MEKQLPINAKLKREPSNENDPNAIQVILQDQPWRHMQIGYVPRDIAEVLAGKLDRRSIEILSAEIRDVAPMTAEAELLIQFRRI